MKNRAIAPVGRPLLLLGLVLLQGCSLPGRSQVDTRGWFLRAELNF
jgi:hypothetical protein